MGGRLVLTQPERGFRAGLDSVLLGASVRPGVARLLDLGAGVGTASLVALALGLAQEATLLERDPAMLALAGENARANGFGARVAAIGLDVTEKGARRAEAGLETSAFGAVIANPPFFDAAAGTRAGEAARAAARHMGAGALDLWVRTAAACATPGGEIVFIYPARGLAELLAAFSARFGGLCVLPLIPREGQPASRVLVRGIKGSRAPLTLFGARALHEAEGHGFRPEFEAVFRGRSRLDW